ncbi:MAG: ribonuclease J [Chloroflexi bacterium AL-W]|nr:ribonuclease J [Chloroflexi bacterium AL-W]
MAKGKLRIVPLGGLGEIGKNMTVFEWGNDAIIIDTGIMFPANDMHGVDYIIPDFKYLVERKDLKIHGIAYTHGHEDHTGAVAHVIEAFPHTPIYATPLTAGLLDVKLRDAGLSEKSKINIFKPGDSFQLGPFKLESFHTTHSIPDCVGFAINTPHGLIVHTGDYKFDNSPVSGKAPDYAKLASFSQRGVLLLMGDSTNSDKPGWTPSESTIDEGFDRVFRNAKGRILVATFASLISRVQQVANAAERYGRKIAIAGYSMNKNVDMALELGHLKVKSDMFVDLNKISTVSKNKLVIMVTGSQGEPSAVLAKMATGKHRQLEVEANDTIVLSSHPIPGNEEMVSRNINRLLQRGANVIYDPIETVHVSGHARQDEMLLMLNLVKPKYLLPVHGELRHLHQHAKLAIGAGMDAKNVFVAENGRVLEIDRGGVRLAERVPGGYVFVDGSGVGDIGRIVIRDREILAQDGFLLVSVNIKRDTGKIIGEPEIISRGFVYLRDSDELLEQVRTTIQDVLTKERNSNGRRREKVQDSLGRLLYNETKRRPMVFSIINEY